MSKLSVRKLCSILMRIMNAFLLVSCAFAALPRKPHSFRASCWAILLFKARFLGV